MNNIDIATGQRSTLQSGPDVYASSGTNDTLSIKHDLPPEPQPTCYILSLQSTCTKDEQQAVINGDALIRDYIVVDMKGGANGNKTGGGGKKSEGVGRAVSVWAVSLFAGMVGVYLL
jgi:hypothetical protein